MAELKSILNLIDFNEFNAKINSVYLKKELNTISKLRKGKRSTEKLTFMREELGKGHSTGLSPGGGAIGCWTAQKSAALPSPTAPKTVAPLPPSVIISVLSLLMLFLPFYSNMTWDDAWTKFELYNATKKKTNRIILQNLSSMEIPFGRTTWKTKWGDVWELIN